MFKKALGVLKGNLNEFKEFAFKGNLIQLAIAVVLGGAFGKLITSFVDNIFMPVINAIAGGAGKPGSYASWQWWGVKVGVFIGDLISFLIIAAAIFFLMVKAIGWIVKLTQKATPSPTSEPTDKECPMCLMKIPIKARKCGHCTTDLPAANVGA